MPIYINGCNKVNDIFINVNGKKKIDSCWVNKNGVPVKVFSTGNIVNGVKIVSWSDGTDEEIAAMLDAHYAGLINIHDYWHIGDKRTVHLSAMSKGEVGETHIAQNVYLVLMHKGGKTLTTPVNGKSTCAFVVGQNNCLYDASTESRGSGYINSENTNSNGWSGCKRRTWCNNTYRNAFPSTLKILFKQFYNVTANGSSNVKGKTADYFALASEKEIFGSVTYANSIAEADNTQFDYYKTSANRVKKLGVETMQWWCRSPATNVSGGFCLVNKTGTSTYSYANHNYGIAPFGCV